MSTAIGKVYRVGRGLPASLCRKDSRRNPFPQVDAMDFENFSIERHGQAVMDAMEKAARAHIPGGAKLAMTDAANYLYLARLEDPNHETVRAVESRFRSMKYAAA